jgi:ferritin-like metal-binding protein YciE
VSVETPPQITSPRELVLADLARLLTVEETLARVVLPDLLRHVSDDKLKLVLEDHLVETREHAGSIAWAFEQLGERPAGTDAPGLDGLREEQREISEVAPDLRDAFAAGAALGGEHYEIAIYSSILPLVFKVAPGGVFETLRRNLKHEFTAMRKLEEIAERLAAS